MNIPCAIIKDDSIYCAACGHKLAQKKGLAQTLGNGEIYIKCKQKNQVEERLQKGTYCNTVNKILL